MIYDFISGEASTQEGGEKFAKWLAEDADMTQKEKKSVIEKIKDFFTKLLDAVRSVIEGQGTLNTTARAGQKAAQQVPVLDDFFNALDNAIDNRQRMLDGDTASKAELRDDIRYSKKLGQFADVNVNSEEELKSLGFDIKHLRLNDYVNVQKTVIKALNDRKFFDNNHNIVVNADTDIVMDIGRSEIRETFSTEKRYVYLPMDKKRAKLAVLTKLPEMIKFAEVENPGEKNRHGGSSKFLMLKHPATIDGKEYSVTLRIKLTPQKNKFYIHDMALFNKNKNEMNSLIAPEDASAVIYNDNSSRNGSVTKSGQNVNTHSMQNGQKNAQNGKNNTRHSLEVDSPDIRYSKRVGFDKALTPAEWKKYNRATQTGEDAGLCVSDNSILVECENESKYQYKYVAYDDMEDGPVIRDVYAIGRLDPNVEDDVASQCHEIARFINAIEEEKYDNREHVRAILSDSIKNTSYVLTRYNPKTHRLYVVGRGSVENGTNTLYKSNRGRASEEDTRIAGDRTDRNRTDRRRSRDVDDTGRTSLLRDEYAQEVLDTLRGMAITLSDEQKAETAYHHDRYGNDLLFCILHQKVRQ